MTPISVKVKFIHYEWDNYQGSSGKVFEREKNIELPNDTQISDVKSECISWLNKNGFVDHWSLRVFNGNGLVSVELL